MKRTLKPTGSKYFSSSAKRVRQTPVVTSRRTYGPRGNNAYSPFQKGSGIERKNIDDTSPLFSTGAATWTIKCINDVGQGTTAITRIGRKIVMKSVYLQGVGACSTACRIIVFYDRQSNGAAPSATDVLTSNTLMAMQNLDNRDRFIILADIFPGKQDEDLCLNVTNGLGWKRYIKCNLETIYGGNAGTVADINSGGLFVMAHCNSGTFNGETGIQRVRFIDE